MVMAPIMMVGGVIMALRQDVGLSWLVLVAVPVLGVIVGFIISQWVFDLLAGPYCVLPSSWVGGECKFLVLGVADTLIYFVDRYRDFSIYDVDFLMLPGVRVPHLHRQPAESRFDCLRPASPSPAKPLISPNGNSARAQWSLAIGTTSPPSLTYRLPWGSAKSFCTSTTMSAVSWP